MTKKIKVIVIDDSALIRKMLSDFLNQDPEIEVVDTAMDGAFAMRKIKRWDPDVITLDIEMRNVDGLTVLKQVMKECPLPVIMVSAFTQKGAETTLKALELGAFDFIGKPAADQASKIVEIAESLIEKVKTAAAAKTSIVSVPRQPFLKPRRNRYNQRLKPSSQSSKLIVPTRIKRLSLSELPPAVRKP